MSLVDPSLPLREPPNTKALDDQPQRIYSSPSNFSEPTTFDDFYDMDHHDTMARSPKRARSTAEAPALPQKSALRASRLVDNLGLKLGGSIEATEPGQATPLDVYLSSEEDASSDADDFSDYDYDSSNEDPASPTRRTSHEVTARVVSVVYSGKPLIVDLTELRRRSTSPNSTRTRSSTVSSNAPTVDRPVTPASSIPSSVEPPTERKHSLLSDVLSKKKPPFLNIDPYANGSKYSLEVPSRAASSNGPEDETSSPAKTPRTPTKLLKGVTRTFSLVRKRSRPALSNNNYNSNVSPASAVPRDAFVPSPSRFSFSAAVPAPLNTNNLAPPTPASAGEGTPTEQPKTPQTPVTYNDILRAVKKNAIMLDPTAQQQDQVVSPVSPGPKRGILSGLASRRKSVKLTKLI
ncbi:hypothetical protein B0H63DRAFT_477880 [Podospora didyma]|uniref:Uncharacterized protein n=1 Tax=Podospora didyma TaxID=330526 RepID=A0AAE0KK85_9PEZI|nr:hypothetical protein B0H63DRAFT_477880 [Podospora didyma]